MAPYTGSAFYAPPTNISDVDELYHYIYHYEDGFYISDGVVFFIFLLLTFNATIGIAANLYLLLAISVSTRMRSWRFIFITVHAICDALICCFHSTSMLSALTRGIISRHHCEDLGVLLHFTSSFNLMSKSLAGVSQIVRIKTRHYRRRKETLFYVSCCFLVLIVIYGLIQTIPTLVDIVHIPYTWDRSRATCFLDSAVDFKALYKGSHTKDHTEDEATKDRHIRVAAMNGITGGIVLALLGTTVIYLAYATINVCQKRRAKIEPSSLLYTRGIIVTDSTYTKYTPNTKTYQDEKVKFALKFL